MLALLLACTSATEVPFEGRDTGVPGAEAIPGVDPVEEPEEVDPTDAVFDPTVVHDVALTMAPADWADTRDNPWAYTWHEAELAVDGEEVGTIGVRAFGYGSLVAGKPSLKLSIDHVVAGQEWRGLEQLKLDNSSQDFGYLDEFVATEVMRARGVPAARTGWARVTVNGEAAGFFVLLESVDDRFVERWFGDDGGTLWGTRQGRWGQGLNPLTDALEYFEPQQADHDGGAGLVALSEVVASGSDADLAAAVDLDLFFKESIGRSVMGSLDCLSCDGNNYYLHQGSDGVWRIVPWDFDVDLGVWYMTTALAVDPRAPWASSPWAYDAATYEPYTDPLLTRQLAMGADVEAEIAALLAGPLAYDAVTARIAGAADLIRDDVHADVLGYGLRFEQRVADLHLFLHSRLSALSGGEVADCAPLPGLPLSFFAPSGTVGWGSLLVDATDWGPGVTVNGAHACTGVFAHTPSTVTVTIPDGYATLSGAVGLQDWNQQCGDGARFRVEQGGAVLWQSDVVRNYDDAVPFSVAIGAGSLSLVAHPVTDYACDTAVWVDVAVAQ